MKAKIFFVAILCAILTSSLVFAQVPKSMNYQGVLRDSNGDLQANETVDVRFTILEGGASIFTETHSGVSTNEFGLLNLKVGTENNTDFSNIDWSAGAKELQVEVDAGNGFEDLGSSELLSVPYALQSGGVDKEFWSKNGSNIFYNEGYVGIGSTNPSHQLSIVSDSNLAGNTAGWIDLSNAPLNIRSNFGGGSGQMTGIGFTVSSFSNTTGAAIVAERTGSNSQANLHFATKRSTAATNLMQIRMTIDSSGNVGIGTVKPKSVLHLSFPTGLAGAGLIIDNQSDLDYWKIYHWSSGRLALHYDETEIGNFNATSGAYSALSDRRKKENIKPLASVLNEVKKLSVKRYNFINDEDKKDYIGFIAQDVEKYFPELISRDQIEEGGSEFIYHMNYSGFGILAIKAIQEQQKTIETLQSELEAIKAEIENLKNR